MSNYTGPPRPDPGGLVWGDGTPIIRGILPEPWGTHPADRFIRVMLAECSGGLWRVDGCGSCLEPELISAAPQDRIDAWQQAYDDFVRYNPLPSGAPEYHPAFPFDTFDDEGAAIADALRAELPGWTIYYQRCWRPKTPVGLT